MDRCNFLKNISLMNRSKVLLIFLFLFLLYTSLFPVNLAYQDSVKVKKADSTEITRPLPKWLLEQKKNQTVKNEQPSDILKTNNYFMFSILFTVIILLVIVVSVSIIIVKRSRQIR